MAVHVVVALDGQFAGLGQVAVEADERVERLDVGGFRILRLALNPLPARYFEGRHHGLAATAGFGVVVVQRAELLQRVADHAQHVVVEEVAVAPLGDQRLVVGGLGGGQQLAGLVVERHRRFVLALQLPVVVVDFLQHGGIDGLQTFVGGLAAALLHALNGGLQRVGGDFGHHPAAGQLGGHQVAVLVLLQRLVHNLHQPVVPRAGLVFLGCRVGLFPQRRICLSR